MEQIIVDGVNVKLTDVQIGETFILEDVLSMITQSSVEREWFIQTEDISVVACDVGNGNYVMVDKEIRGCDA